MKKFVSRLFFPIIGMLSLIWFLIRVIPKPSRASYPCMRASFPLASTFVVYLLGLATSAFAAGRVRVHWRNARYALVAVFLLVAVVSGFLAFQADQPYVYADSTALDTPNAPMGQGIGVNPGRVVWAWDPEATNEDCANNRFGEAYYLPKHSNLDVIDEMITRSVLQLTGKSSVAEAWHAMFVNFNERTGKGAVSYQDGEEIFIKINGVGASVNSEFEMSNLSNYTMSRTSPQPVLVLLRHLVNELGVPQQNIGIGDPMKDLSNDYFDVWHNEFPDVKYISKRGGNGRTRSRSGRQETIFYSDRGEVLREGSWSDASDGAKIYDDRLYTCLEDADYMINVPALKAHHRAGMTLIAKNHFGSHTRSAAMHLHMGLINPDGQPVAHPKRAGYGLYRIQVDLLGHKHLGAKTMLVVVDGLWGGPDANDRPCKWEMAPFNNDWPSSIFMSMDQVAIASVCLDFLKAEFTPERHEKTYPHMEGVDDYLQQAADPANWPEGIEYDPENDGSVLSSLGVHEHWNNADDKQYSGDLGTDDGIELVRLMDVTGVETAANLPGDFSMEPNYPNPFNPSTTIRYHLSQPADVELSIYNVTGQRVATLPGGQQAAGSYTAQWQPQNQPAGVYLARFQARQANGKTLVESQRMVYVK